MALWLKRPAAESAPARQIMGERLTLRLGTMADWPEWLSLRQNSRDFLEPWEPAWTADALSKQGFQRRIRRQAEDWRDGKAVSLLSFRNDDGALLGGVGLSNIRRGVAQCATLGYWIGAPFARQGYTAEAAALILNLAFDELRLHRVEAACLPHNAASLALLKGLGFRREGLARSYLKIAGRWEDHVLHALLDTEWQAAER